ncbi:MAG: regulatory protein [Pseudonocardiales bacterium]|nr:regulatory protein [Pseudonocardiales bacterium]
MRAATSPPPEDDGAAGPDDPESVARIICLRALSQRARTRAELAATLTAKGVPDAAANTVLDRFTEVGLINDNALAVEFAQAAHAERGLSRRAVATKLRQRGVDDEVITTAVSGIDAESERAAALELARRKAGSLRGLDTPVQVRRLVGLLARRGYAPGLAYAVTREVLADVACLEPLDLGDG